MTVEREEGPPGRSYSNSVRVSNAPGTWVFVSGQFGTDDAGNIVAGGFAAQSKAALRNVVDAVQKAGGRAGDIIKITAYVTTLSDYPQYNEVRRDVFGDELPASTAVAVAALVAPTASIEVDAVAYLPGPEGRG